MVKGLLLLSRPPPFVNLMLKGMRTRGGGYSKISRISLDFTLALVGYGGVSNSGELIKLMMPVCFVSVNYF